MLDVCAVLRSSVHRRRTILTVPWIVEFLSMLDYVGPFLPFTGLLCTFCSRSTSEFMTYRSKMISLCDCVVNYGYVCVSGGWYWVEEVSCVT